MLTPIGGGKVIFPRKYHIDYKNPDRSYVEGVDEESLLCRVFLRLPDGYQKGGVSSQGKAIPDLEEFADDDLECAKNPCLAAPDNNRSTPSGTLLCEQVSRYGDTNNFTATWMSVLRSSPSKPPALIGKGYLEISSAVCKEPEFLQLRREYEVLLQQSGATDFMSIQNPDVAARILDIYRRAIGFRNMWYTACLLRVNKIKYIEGTDSNWRQVLVDTLAVMLPAYTREGTYGSAMIRVRTTQGIVERSVTFVKMTYDAGLGRAKTVEEVLAEPYFTKQLNWLSRHVNASGLIEIIPVHRINSQTAKSQFDNDLALGVGGIDAKGVRKDSKLMKTYLGSQFYNNPFSNYLNDGALLYTDVGVRLAKIRKGAGKGNMLLSNIHGMRKPQGRVGLINPAGGEYAAI
ncbi:hypothetical protein [Neptuniibacter sp. QD37_11]|uniref:hypothetical protein n=1 Tax=Neptuniibacter sp. QD37_11 TaxID=3398209 RepID=UPI0039F54796